MQARTAEAAINVQLYELPFRDLTVGECMVSDFRTINHHMIRDFAGLSGDHNPIHLDDEFAKTTRYGGIIAHGALVLSVTTGLLTTLGIEKLTAVFTNFDWEFLRPVRPGDSIRVALRLADLEPLPKNRPGKVATLEAEIQNQQLKVVQRARMKVLISFNP